MKYLLALIFLSSCTKYECLDNIVYIEIEDNVFVQSTLHSGKKCKTGEKSK